MLACVRAYNDFLAEYAAVDPRRFIPIMALPMWDMDAVARRRSSAPWPGHKGVIMTGEPTFWGLPPIAESYWDRLWALCQEMELAVNFHIGSGDMSIFDHAAPSAGPHANYAGFGVQFGLANARVIAEPDHRRCLSPVPRHQVRIGGKRRRLDPVRPGAPGLAVAELRRAASEHPEYDLLPSEYFKRQMYGCFWFERAARSGPRSTSSARTGSLYESDFPHPTSMAPGPATVAVRPADYIAEALAGQPADVVEKILYGNAARIYHLD